MKSNIKYCNKLFIFSIIFLLSTFSSASIANIKHNIKNNNQDNDLVWIEQGPIQKSTLYSDGSTVDLQTMIISQFISGSETKDVTIDDLQMIVQSRRDSFLNSENIVIVNNNNPINSFNIVYNTDGSVPSGAIIALGDCEAYLENLFGDSITVSINVAFANLGSGILGQTSVYTAGSVGWSTSRDSLQNDMDSDDVIQSWLPSGSTIPIRYDDDSSTVTDEGRVFWSKGNYKAVIGSISGVIGEVTLNTDYTWDYDPSNGVNGYSFNDVMLHETGHAMGFISYAEEWLQGDNDIYGLDIFRFKRDDGGNDYNPDSYAEFQTTPRLVDYNKDSVSDIIDGEYRMSDGNPYQASHFYYTSNALMAPAIGSGQTNYPDYMTTADLNMFDAIGWDYSLTPNDPPVTPEQPSGPTPVPSDYARDYITVSSDPDNDQIFYQWNWGDQVSGWLGPYLSGSPVIESYTWNNPGIYSVQVKAKDINDAESDWSEPLIVQVVMPGDLDLDGDIDLSDLAQLLSNYGITSGADYQDGDINGDGDVDLSDLAILLGNYGASS